MRAGSTYRATRRNAQRGYVWCSTVDPRRVHYHPYVKGEARGKDFHAFGALRNFFFPMALSMRRR